MNKKIVKDAMILTAFTLVLGLILGVVNEITKGPIAKVNYEAEQESYRNVFKDADSFEEYKDFDAKKAEDIIAKSDYANDEILSVNTALDKSGEVLGYVISVTSHAETLDPFDIVVIEDTIIAAVPLHVGYQSLLAVKF